MKAVLQLLLVLEFVVRWSIATASWKHTEALLEWIEDLGGGIEGVGLMPISGMGMGVFSISDLEVCMHAYIHVTYRLHTVVQAIHCQYILIHLWAIILVVSFSLGGDYGY